MNTKMKVLSLALVGLCGYAGSALAGTTCPTSPSPPWTAVNALGGTAQIVAGGYAGTACRLDSTLTGDATSFATVEDDSPSAEPRYRVHFIINADSIGTLGAVDAAYIFSATSTAGPQIQLSIVGDGAGGKLVSFIVPNANAAGGSDVGTYALAAGENHIEFDLDNSGHFSFWLNNNDPNNATFTDPNFSNGGATIETAFLGLAGPTTGFVAAAGGAVGFDQFDSRRTTFIGY
ncbi:MAG TPA: hypothetical protein VGC30_03900 [Dokdonella sp.]